MGQAEILGNLGDGLYTVLVKRNRAVLDARLTRVAESLTKLDEQKTELQEELVELQEALDAALAELDELIEAFDDLPEEDHAAALEEINTKLLEASEAAQPVSQLKRKIGVLDFDLAALTARQNRLNELAYNIDNDMRSAWCADLSDELTGTVSTVEVIGQPTHVLIAPQQRGTGENLPSGALTPIIPMSPAQAAFSWAILPGWQKFRPTYRTGEIVEKTGEVCSVILDGAWSVAQQLHINQGTGRLDDVPIEYMSCDGGAFEIGDKVVVEFTEQKWEQPVVVGFVQNPKPCGIARFAVRVGAQHPTFTYDQQKGFIFVNTDCDNYLNRCASKLILKNSVIAGEKVEYLVTQDSTTAGRARILSNGIEMVDLYRLRISGMNFVPISGIIYNKDFVYLFNQSGVGRWGGMGSNPGRGVMFRLSNDPLKGPEWDWIDRTSFANSSNIPQAENILYAGFGYRFQRDEEDIRSWASTAPRSVRCSSYEGYYRDVVSAWTQLNVLSPVMSSRPRICTPNPCKINNRTSISKLEIKNSNSIVNVLAGGERITIREHHSTTYETTAANTIYDIEEEVYGTTGNSIGRTLMPTGGPGSVNVEWGKDASDFAPHNKRISYSTDRQPGTQTYSFNEGESSWGSDDSVSVSMTGSGSEKVDLGSISGAFYGNWTGNWEASMDNTISNTEGCKLSASWNSFHDPTYVVPNYVFFSGDVPVFKEVYRTANLGGYYPDYQSVFYNNQLHNVQSITKVACHDMRQEEQPKLVAFLTDAGWKVFVENDYGSATDVTTDFFNKLNAFLGTEYTPMSEEVEMFFIRNLNEDEQLALARAVFDAVNQVRIENGVEPLQHLALMAPIAQNHAQKIKSDLDALPPEEQGAYDMHEGDQDRFDEMWSLYPGTTLAAENAAYDSLGRVSVLIQGWKDSVGHFASMINPDYIGTGIGVYEAPDGSLTAVQLFLG